MLLPNGEKIAILTVGGRTSAVIPSVQKKTGPVAKEMDEAEAPDEEQEEKTPKKKTVRKGIKSGVDATEDTADHATKPKTKTAKGRKSAARADNKVTPVVDDTVKNSRVKEEVAESETGKPTTPANSSKKRKLATSPAASASTKQRKTKNAASSGLSTRRSGRLSKT